MCYLVGRISLGEAPLDAERLRELLSYNPETGVFVWKKNLNRTDLTGKRAGTLHKNRYRRIKIGDRLYREHRLVWLYVHGRWPSFDIDHINNNGMDNRLSNLREATKSQNMANAIGWKNNTSGFRGVFLRRDTGKYRVIIGKDGKLLRFGQFADPVAAYEVYLAKMKELFGNFAK